MRSISPLALEVLGERARPVTSAEERVLAVPSPLASLLPGAVLRRGSVVAVATPGGPVDGRDDAAASLALGLVSAASAEGSWCALVGAPGLGLAAAAELGLALDRLPVVAAPPPTGSRSWAWVVATLLDGLDAVVAWPPLQLSSADARRLRDRARRRSAVLVIVGPWPGPVDLRLEVVGVEWEGVGAGAGRLRRRRVALRAGGRAWAGREPLAEAWLPADGGGLAACEASSSAAVDRGRGAGPGGAAGDRERRVG